MPSVDRTGSDYTSSAPFYRHRFNCDRQVLKLLAAWMGQDGKAQVADIGAQVQCILFTHHRRTVEIAADRLGDKVDIIELGTAP